MAISARQIRELLDWPLILAVLALLVASFIGLESATGEQAMARVQGLSNVQLVWGGLMFAAMAGAVALPPRFWYGMAYILYAVGLGLLALTLVFGVRGMGAERWLEFGPVRLQASEIAKVLLILALSRYLTGHRVSLTNLRHAVGVGTLVLAPVRSDMASARSEYHGRLHSHRPADDLLGRHEELASVRHRVAVRERGVRVRWVGAVAGVLPALRRDAVPSAAPHGMGSCCSSSSTSPSALSTPTIWEGLKPHQQRRIETFFSPEKDPLGAGYQIIQSKVAIGSGGMDGKGFRQGSQTRLAFLPETHTDFIFAVIGEEWGFRGAIGVLLVLFLVVWRILRLSIAVNDPFGSFMCIGIGSMLLVHIVVNIGMTVGLAPVTGLPLPFVSYGGSALITDGFAVGLALGAGLRRFE